MKPKDKTTKFPEDLLRCIKDKDSKGREIETNLMFRRDIPMFRTDFFYRSMGMFNRWKLFRQAPPRGQGFANERNTTCQILAILQEEESKFDAWESEKARAARK